MTEEFPYHVSAPNSSHCITGVLLGWIRKLVPEGGDILLVEETPGVIDVFKNYFPSMTYTVLNYNDDVFGTPFDLNVITDLRKNYDCVYNQATLEHICRPSIGLENLVKFAKVGGHTFIHTHNPDMGLHRWPIDCARFLDDFFSDITRYVGATLVEFLSNDVDMFAAYRREV